MAKRKVAVPALALCLAAFCGGEVTSSRRGLVLRLRGGMARSLGPERFTGGEGGRDPGNDAGVAVPGRGIAPVEGPMSGLVSEWAGVAAQNELLNMPITSEQAEELRARGIIRGKWAAESEEEPTSDIEDAQNVGQWPDEWGGEEENDGVNAHTQGPVKMFKGTKYNKDVLPSGEVNPETLRRLERSLTDDGPEQYTRVLIDDGDGSVLQESSDAAPPLRGSTKATIVSGVKLPPAISKGIAQRWLDEVAVHNKFKGKNTAPNSAFPELDIKESVSVRRKEAEMALDEAIKLEDEAKVDAAVEELKRIDILEEQQPEESD